jgi:hypothetical protein
MKKSWFILGICSCAVYPERPLTPTSLQAPPASQASALTPQPIQVSETPVKEVQCGESGYMPLAPVDIDGDGLPERPAAVRNGKNFDVALYEVPSFKKTFSASMRADSLRIVTTPNTKGKTGDLWVHVGISTDEKGTAWEHELLHLEDGALVSKAKLPTGERPNLTLDLDGDGRVDPILSDEKGTFALLGDKKITFANTPSSTFGISGMPGPYGFESPVDLDSDGDLDVFAQTYDWIGVIDLKQQKLVWKKEVKETSSSLVRWAGAPAIMVTEDDSYLLDTTSAHKKILSLGQKVFYIHLSSQRAPSYVYPDKNGQGILTERFGLGMLWATPESKQVIELPYQIAMPADLSHGPQGLSNLIALEQTGWGDASMGGMGESKFSLRVASLSSMKLSEPFYQTSINGEGALGVSFFDLNGDKENEILLEARSTYMDCDMQGGGGGSQWRIIKSDGTLLYEDASRYFSYARGYRNDQSADAAVLDLGNHHRAVRFRTWNQEWWVADTSLQEIPACLE